MENMTFEQALNRLEEIVQLLEKDTTSLDQSVDLFQEGIQLSNYCSKKINNVEDKVAKILLNGKEVKAPGSERTVMFQEHALFPWLNVIQNIKFGMEINGVPKNEQDFRGEKYLKMMQLEDYKNYAIHQLSGGMRQRVALARAFTMDSEILLMDEPFSALDKQTSNHLRQELQDIWMKTHKTIFFITHSVEEAVYLGDRVVVMSGEDGGIKNIVPIELDRPRHVYNEDFIAYRHKILEEIQGGDY